MKISETSVAFNKSKFEPAEMVSPIYLLVCLREIGMGTFLLQQGKEKTGGRWVPRRRLVP